MLSNIFISQKIPKLRFRDFQGEYSKIKLWDICDKVGDGLHSTPIYDEMWEYYFVNWNNISNWKIVVNPDTKKVDRSEFDKYKKELSNRSLLLSINWTIWNLAFYNWEKIILGKSACYINLLENTNIEYIYTLLQTNGIIRYFNKAVTWSTIKNLWIISIKNTPVNTPALPEQQKVASFLWSVDTRIEQLREKKSLLEEYKKWVMQKIFAREIRFKDENGKDYGEWEEKKLGEIAKFSKWKLLSKSDLLEDGKNECIHYWELFTTYSEIIKKIKSKTNLEEKMNFSESNDILMPTSDVTPNWLATASALSKSGVVLGWDILIIRSKLLLNSFFCYYVKGHRKDIMRLVSWSTVYHLSWSEMASLEIPLPSLPEQQKIASFLSEIDSKIQSTTEQLEEALKWKKGLLQGMFI